MDDGDVRVDADRLRLFSSQALSAIGCSDAVAREVGDHLVEADLAGVHSHGTVRLAQYAEQAEEGVYHPEGEPSEARADGGARLVDGGDGFGIPATRLAADLAIEEAQRLGLGAVGVFNVAHTGRIGAFAERIADAGCFGLILGGGSRKEWRQVAPFGGIKAMLPTNPYAFAMPGDEHGPVVVDFATSSAAGGKMLAARAAGKSIPEGLIIDKMGQPSTDPNDYFSGGAILPMAGPKGYGMALIAELLGEAIFKESRNGMNWLVIALDLGRFRGAEGYRAAAADCLQELAETPPAPGFESVQIPGRRERETRMRYLDQGIPFARQTIKRQLELADRYGLDRDLLPRV